MSLYVNDKSITDSTDIANKFNNLFVSIGPLLTEKSHQLKSHYHALIVLVILLLFLMYLVRRLNIPSVHLKKSSAGWDEIPTSMAKKCITGFIEPLTYLINKSFSEGIFPTELKLARVVPILKAGDPMFLTKKKGN